MTHRTGASRTATLFPFSPAPAAGEGHFFVSGKRRSMAMRQACN